MITPHTEDQEESAGGLLGKSAMPKGSGVTILPEPTQPPIANIQSIPREQIGPLAKQGVEGAGDQLQSLGKKILYKPKPVIGSK